MPRRQEPTKDAAICEKPRGAESGLWSGGVRMGKPTNRNGLVLLVEHIDQVEGTRGTETSKYPEEEKESTIPPVVASEKGRAQTDTLSPRA
jgi:hypothetical protein